MKATALRGVNLGGWLIIERWMTPSLFEGLDAGDECTLSTTKKGRERIRQHRQEFINEETESTFLQDSEKKERDSLFSMLFNPNTTIRKKFKKQIQTFFESEEGKKKY